MTARKPFDKATVKPGDSRLNESVDTDRGSVVNQGSEDDEVLITPAGGAASTAGEADQSGTRGARGKPGGTIEVEDGKVKR
jgi:hypothetical protein